MNDKKGIFSPESRWIVVLGAVAAIATILGLFYTAGLLRPFGSSPEAATATEATATQTSTLPPSTAPYSARVPGPGCDTGEGVWNNAHPESAEITCTSAGVDVKTPSNAANFGDLQFTWPGHPFPSSYSVRVEITLTQNSCGGIRVRNSGFSGYGFYVCYLGTGGVWVFRKFDEVGNTTRTSGNVAMGSSALLKVRVADGVQELSIDNEPPIYTGHDASYSKTDYLVLSAYGGGSYPGSATFSNFIYAPL